MYPEMVKMWLSWLFPPLSLHYTPPTINNILPIDLPGNSILKVQVVDERCIEQRGALKLWMMNGCSPNTDLSTMNTSTSLYQGRKGSPGGNPRF